MGKVIMSGIVPLLEAPVTFDPVFANNSWADIVEACRANRVPSSWVVGDQKTMTINGTDYAIDIIGKNHDEYSDGSGKAPLTFQMHDCYSTNYQMSSDSTNGYSDSAMRTTTLPALLALMPSEVQTGIKEVNKITSAGSQSSMLNTTADRLFLLSEQEVFGSASTSFAGEGDQYEYYTAGNSKIKNKDGTASIWWLRSPKKTSDSHFCCVASDGSVGSYSCSLSRAISFAFCF